MADISTLARGLDWFGGILQKPTQAFLGEPEEKTRFSTRDLIAEHSTEDYLKSHPEEKALADRVKVIKAQESATTVRKILWVATIVLPLLSLLGIALQKLARCEPKYAQEVKNQDKAKKIEPLKKSYQEFVEYTQKMGAIGLVDSGNLTRDLYGMRDALAKQFGNCGDRLCRVMEKVTKNMLDLLHDVYNVTEETKKYSNDSRIIEPAEELPLYIYGHLHKLHGICESNDIINMYFIAAGERGFGADYYFLTKRKDAFLAQLN